MGMKAEVLQLVSQTRRVFEHFRRKRDFNA